MTADDSESVQFIVKKTGVAADVVSRVVNLGEPWPFIQAFDRLLQTSRADAESLGVPWEAALDANVGLLDFGIEGFDADSLDRHLQRVVDVSGIEEATVIMVSKALHDFFRAKFAQLQQVVDQRRSAP